MTTAHDPIAVPLLLLAGGRGERAGGPKGLRPWRGRPWLLAQLESLNSAAIQDVVVVLGHQWELYEPMVPGLREHREGRLRVGHASVHVVVSPEPELGPFRSLQTAIANVANSHAAGVLVLPVDVPVPAPEVFWKVLGQVQSGVLAIQPTWQSRAGHPVWLAMSLAQSLLERSADAPDARLDRVLQSLDLSQIVRVAVDDPRVRMNLNQPSNWAAFESWTEQH